MNGVKPPKDILTAGVTVTVNAAPNTFVYADYDTVIDTGNTSDQTISAGVRIRF